MRAANFLQDSFLRQSSDIDPIANPEHLATGNAIAVKKGSFIDLSNFSLGVDESGNREIMCDPKIDDIQTWWVEHAAVNIIDEADVSLASVIVPQIAFETDSFLKQNPDKNVTDQDVLDGNAIKIGKGAVLSVTEMGMPQNKHRKIKLAANSDDISTTVTWYVFAPHIALLRSSRN
jgi:hypothetical protein